MMRLVQVHGPPVGSAPRGVILHPTSFDAVHDELEYNIGPGRTLNTNLYTVIVTNMLGNGVSASPSTLAAAVDESGNNPNFSSATSPPRITVGDNVRAQRQLLISLGVLAEENGKNDPPAPRQQKLRASPPLALVYGYSMGALQAFEWAVAHPNEVARVAAVCGASRCGDVNHIFLRSLEAALKASSARLISAQPIGGLRASRPLLSSLFRQGHLRNAFSPHRPPPAPRRYFTVGGRRVG